jgi:heat shock protein HtpX
MIEIPRVFMFIAWVLIGPFNMHHEGPTMILSFLAASGLGIAVAVRRSSKRQSIALLSVMGIMLYQSLQLIGRWLHIELGHQIFMETEEVRHFFSYFFAFNASLAIVGAVAACGVAVSLEFRKSHLSLAGLFPQITFVSAPFQLAQIVGRLSRIAGVRPPKVSVIDSGTPAAFITRSKQGYVLAVSVGLMESLSTEELEACLAHELSHLKNNDFAMRSFATVAKVALFAHPLSYFIEPAVYRARELLADKTATELVGERGPLISALSKLRESQNYLKIQPGSIGIACLHDSVSGNRFVRLFDKHPTMDARIRALQEM